MHITSKTFFVTGAASGLGRGISRYLLQEGHRVFLTDVQAEELLYCCNDHLPSSLGKDVSSRIGYCVMDVGTEASVATAVAKCNEMSKGELHCVVNNAGLPRPYWPDGKDITEGPLDHWETYLRINLTGPMLVSKHTVPLLRKSRGAIVNISSFRHQMSQPNSEPYAATKSGLIGLTHSMAISLGPDVRVNAISPGWFPVPSERHTGEDRPWDAGLSSEDQHRHPVGRAGTVDDLGRLVEFLGACEGGFLTGENITLDGIIKLLVHYSLDRRQVPINGVNRVIIDCVQYDESTTRNIVNLLNQRPSPRKAIRRSVYV